MDANDTSNTNQKASKDNLSAKPSTTADASTQKAKPNKELLEKLKEEMRKIRKPNVDVKDEATQNIEAKQSETLLTIPPLLIGNKEFALSSCNFLMTSDKNTKTDDLADDKSGKILFNDLKSDQTTESNKDDRAKKRKVSDSDVDSDSEENSNSSSNSDRSDDSDNNDSNIDSNSE